MRVRIVLLVVVVIMTLATLSEPLPVHAANLGSAYIGGGQYVVEYSPAYTQYVDSKLLGFLPNPTLKTICDRYHIGLWAKIVAFWLKPVKALSYVCDAYKAYLAYNAVKDWIAVRRYIHAAATAGGCALFLWNSRQTYASGSIVHPAVFYPSGSGIPYVPYRRYVLVQTTMDKYVHWPYQQVACI